MRYWAAASDPKGDVHPIFYTFKVNGAWVNVTTLPMIYAAYPLFELVRCGEVVVIPDSESELGARTGAGDIGRARGFRSLLLTPLRNEKGLIGLISVTRKEPGTFADHHVALLRTFADQAVIAIENVRLFDELQARTRELSLSLESAPKTLVTTLKKRLPHTIIPKQIHAIVEASRVSRGEPFSGFLLALV